MVCDNRFPVSHLIETFVWWLEQCRDLFALSQHATACDNKLQVAVRNDMRLFVLKKYYSVLQSTTPVLQSTTPVLLCTTKYYSSTTLYYKVLLQYYSVLHSTTPVLVCTTTHYSSTTPYYKILLQYSSVLQSTTPVLLCTTKYYSSTTPYYTVLLQYYSVLLQYYSVLQSTTPVLLCTTPVLVCTTKYYSSTTLYYSSTTLYYKVLLRYRATCVIVQTHQILRLPRKMNLMIDPCHTWNAIYNARGNKCHCPNSPNTAPATKNESHDWSLSHMKRYLHCAEQQVSLSKLTKYCACHEKWISWLILVTHETLFTMRGVTNVIVQTHQILRWISWLILVTHETLFTMRGVTNVIVQTHQILRLPRKMNLMIDPCHTWNAIYNARSNKCHCPNSPNTAPATKNESHDWSLSHMKRYLQCAEQQVSLSKLTKYCAYHAKWFSKISKKFAENGWNFQCAADPRMIREWNRPSATRLATEVTFHAHHEHFVLKNTTFRAPAIIPNFTEYCACHEKWHLNFTKYCACHEKWHLNFTKYCACHEKWHLNFTKYCACHEKWHLNFSK